MIMGLAYMTSPHFCDVILSKLCFNCTQCWQLDHSFPAVLDILRKGLNLQALLDISNDQNAFSFQGGFAPLPPDQGLCPWTPVIGSCSTLAMVPPNPFRRLSSSFLEPPTYFDKFTPMNVTPKSLIESSSSSKYVLTYFHAQCDTGY